MGGPGAGPSTTTSELPDTGAAHEAQQGLPQAAAEKIDRTRLYSPLEAVRLAKETATTKYDPTVEVAMRLGVDPRKADQMVRGTVNLPHGTGKTARVLVFATGERADEAEPPAPTSSARTT